MDKTEQEEKSKTSKTGKALAWSGGIFGAILLILLSIFGYYNLTDSGSTKVFRVAGSDIGQYEKGSFVTSTNRFDHPLGVGDVVVYSDEETSQTANILAEIIALPGSEVPGNSYKVLRSKNREEIISFDQVKWLITDKVY